MSSTTQMPSTAVLKSFSDAFSALLDEATQVTRISSKAYVKGVDAIVEQQKLASESSRQWMSEIATIQSDLAQQVVRSYTPVTDRLAEPAVESTEIVPAPVAKVAPAPVAKVAEASAKASAKAAQSTRAAAKPSQRRRTATRRQTPRQATTPAATAALASAVGAGLTNWTSEGYDSLTAVEVIEKLPRFSQRDLREVDTYEQTHQARQTVLQRIESLRTPEPAAGYDELTVPEVQALISAGDAAHATSVRDYERSHKKRDGVLNAAQARIDQA